MPFTPTAFHRLLEPLDRRVLARCVEQHNGNRGVGEGDGAWTCQRHLKALLFAQFAGLKSLREIEQALAARPEALYHLDLRLPRRSTLSDASAARPAEVFADLARHLMGMASRMLRKQGKAVIELIDTSPIPLRDTRFVWPEAGSRVRGLNMYVHYDPLAQTPVCFALSSPKVSDVAQARNTTIEAGTIYVFDKGFSDYSWWHDICQANATFVTRLKKNARRRNIEPTGGTIEAPILADNMVRIGHKMPRGGFKNRLYDTSLRDIVIEREGKAPLHLVTNDLSSPALRIAELYKQRWQIELFFKWIKQNLRIKAFFGRSENAVRTQLYVAIIAFLLLRMFKDKYAKAFQVRTIHLLARLKVSLLNPVDLTDRTKPQPRSPVLRPPKPQLELVFS